MKNLVPLSGRKRASVRVFFALSIAFVKKTQILETGLTLVHLSVIVMQKIGEYSEKSIC